MDDLNAAGIFVQIVNRVLAAHIHPAGVKLGLKQIGGHFAVENVDGVLAVDLLKLKVMVVIAELHAQFFGLFAQRLCGLDDLKEFGLAGTEFGGQIGDDHIGAADLAVGFQQVGVFQHVDQRHMGRDGGEADVGAHFFDLGGRVAEQAGKLHTVIAQRFDLFQRAFKVGRHIVTHREELQSNGKIFHDVVLSTACWAALIWMEADRQNDCTVGRLCHLNGGFARNGSHSCNRGHGCTAKLHQISGMLISTSWPSSLERKIPSMMAWL